MGASAEIIIAALTTSGSLSALAGVIRSWIMARQKQQEQKNEERLTIRISDDREISIRIDNATSKEIDDFIATVVEARGARDEPQAGPEAIG